MLAWNRPMHTHALLCRGFSGIPGVGFLASTPRPHRRLEYFSPSRLALSRAAFPVGYPPTSKKTFRSLANAFQRSHWWFNRPERLPLYKVNMPNQGRSEEKTRYPATWKPNKTTKQPDKEPTTSCVSDHPPRIQRELRRRLHIPYQLLDWTQNNYSRGWTRGSVSTNSQFLSRRVLPAQRQNVADITTNNTQIVKVSVTLSSPLRPTLLSL